jgi:hypothetical protein
MEDTKLYKKDLIGLKKLKENGKIFKETINSSHMHVSIADTLRLVVPYLN